jgi:hypothetical protein
MIKKFKAIESIPKGLQRKWFFLTIWLIFLFIKLRICGPRCQQHVQEIILPKKCQVVYKNSCTHFSHIWFFTKILIHNYICMWEITTTMKINIIWIIQYFALQIISCRFYIWKVAKTKFFNHVSKQWHPNHEWTQTSSSYNF